MSNAECRTNAETQMTKRCGKTLLCFCPSSLEIRHSSLSHHLSHSPMTKSRLPSTAGTSLTMQPGKSSGRILRLTNDGARIFSRYGTPPPLLLMRSEEHTSELQSRVDLVCRLLLEKKKKQ